MPACSFCGAQQPEGATFCDECGRPMASARPGHVGPPPAASPATPVGRAGAEGRTVVASSVCPACGVQVAPMDTFCGNCGASLRAPAPAPGPIEQDRALHPPVHAGMDASRPVPAALKPRCVHCGAELAPNAVFCDRCGAAVKAAQEPGGAGLVTETAASHAPVESAEARREADVTAWQTPPPVGQPVVSPGAIAAMETSAHDASLPPLEAEVAQMLPPYEVLARIVHPSSGIGWALPVGKAEATLGRDDPVRGIYPDLDMTDYGGPVGGVSRLHTRITITVSEGAGEFKFYAEDMDSVNGTFVNDEKLAPGERRRLSHGDELRLGRVKVVFQLANPEADS